MNRLGDILVEKGTLTPEQMDAALQAQRDSGRQLGDVLLSMDLVSEEDMARALALQFGIPFMELDDNFKMEKEEVLLIPESVARRHGVIVLRRSEGPVVTAVMKDPMDSDAVATVRSLTNLEVHKAVSTEDRILGAINRFYRSDAFIESSLRDIVRLEAIQEGEDGDDAVVDSEQLRVLANDAPVVRFVNLVLMQAIRDRASDIHFEPQEQDVQMRLRVDGVLREVTPPPKNLYPGIVTRIKILSRMDIAERRLPLDGRFNFHVDGQSIDVRVSTLPEVHGEKMVLRILDKKSLPGGVEELGFQEDMMQQFLRIISLPHGIILVTGPTGSGKTSTLYCALAALRSPDRNIQTVEDPVEYMLAGVNQMQVKPQIGLDFADALRSILRQDPDVIMIGEIRDAATAQIAMRASLTGHLVLSTLHTNDAPSAFVRLVDIGIQPYLIAATVKLVMSQRLVRKICRHCHQPIVPSEEALRVASDAWPDAVDWHYCHGEGCSRCGHAGYRGRTAIFEFLEATAAVREMVLDGTGEVVFRRRAIELGMEPLFVNGLRKVKDGVTTVEEVMGVSTPEDR